MPIDLGRLMRLRGAIQAALDSIPERGSAYSAEGLKAAYLRLREEAKQVVDPALWQEFDRLFPPSVMFRGQDEFAKAQEFVDAKILLGSLGGCKGSLTKPACMLRPKHTRKRK